MATKIILFISLWILIYCSIRIDRLHKRVDELTKLCDAKENPVRGDRTVSEIQMR